jgi:hypothetical protein
MRRSLALLTVALFASAAVAGCSSSTPTTTTTASSAAATASAAQTPASPSASPSASTTDSATTPADSGGGNGTITFKGKVSGKMTISACASGIAQLAVDIDGQGTTYAGIIDADDFSFVGPNSTGYTLAKGASKPKISGKTYTVNGTKLIGILNDDTLTATGSVTCP